MSDTRWVATRDASQLSISTFSAHFITTTKYISNRYQTGNMALMYGKEKEDNDLGQLIVMASLISPSDFTASFRHEC